MTNTHVRLIILVVVFIFYISFKSGECLAQTGNEITLSTLMDEMVSAESDVCFPVPFYAAKQLTSYDRRSLVPGTTSWHANDDWSGYIRLETNNGRQEKVLFDEIGPGVLTRIITTGGAGNANLRIYFDDEAEASIIIPSYDISKFPITIPAGMIYLHEHYNTTQGCSFYYPIPYAKRCKITVDDISRAAYIYHVNYRIYEEGTTVKTFTIDDANALENKAVEVGNKLQNPQNYTDGELLASMELLPGANLTLNMPAGAKAIRTLNFNISGYDNAEYEQLMRGLIVKMTFDDTQTVWAPLSDFSGAGMGAPKVDSWYLSADGAGNVTIRFTMPYTQTAKVEIENITKFTTSATIKANVSDWTWLENTLYFHASWRQERSLKTNVGLDYNNATLTGRGVFKGDVLSLYNYGIRWYGEGDEHIWVDNESFPSHFGCGTEDYYNTTYAPIHVYFNPFGGAPREDDESSHGYNTFVRTRNLDVIPFNDKLKFDFELISWDGGLVDYASTVYWYGDIQSMALNPSSKDEALQPLPRSNSVKVEAESGIVSGGAIRANYGSASGGIQVGNLDNVGAHFQVTTNVAKAGLKTIAIIYSNGMGDMRYKSLYVNDVKIGQLSFKPTAGWSNYSILNTNVTFKAGVNSIKIQRDPEDNVATDIDFILVPAETAIDVMGSVIFENVTKDLTSTKIFTIRNTGSAGLTVSNIEVPDGFTLDWQNGYIPEDSEQEVKITFTPTEVRKYDGMIKVISNAKAGVASIAVSGTVSINTLVNEKKYENIPGALILFPNPTNNFFSMGIDQQLITAEAVTVYSLHGQKVKSFINTQTLDISELKKGMYMVSVAYKGITYNRTVILN